MDSFTGQIFSHIDIEVWEVLPEQEALELIKGWEVVDPSDCEGYQEHNFLSLELLSNEGGGALY